MGAAQRSKALYLSHLYEIALAIVCICRRVQKLADEIVVHGLSNCVLQSCAGLLSASDYISCSLKPFNKHLTPERSKDGNDEVP